MSMMISDDNGKWQDLSGPFTLSPDDEKSPAVREHHEKFSFAFGDMEMHYIVMPGIYIAYGDILLNRQSFRVHRFGGPEVVEMHFSMNGEGVINNYISGERYVFGDNKHSMNFIPEIDGDADYQPHTTNRIFEVHFTAPYFTGLAKGAGATLERVAEYMNNGREIMLGQPELSITPAMHECIRDIIGCNFKDGLRRLFLQAKCIELLSLQAEAFEQPAGKRASSVLRSAYDRDCIMYAKDYLLQHMHEPPTLDALAGIAGTNVFKLKNGFKELFNNTVFGYLNDARLTQAKELLLSGQSIKEITDRLGYSSVQHFGSAFRKKFGTTPGRLKA
jgi:AraC-like DNA-binding protein